MAATTAVNAKTAPATVSIAGTWKLNAAASSFETMPLKSETRVYTVNGNKITMHSEAVDTAGKAVNVNFTAAYDGKQYPEVGSPIADSIALTKLNARTVTAIMRKGSKIAATSRSILSADGKRFTITRKIGTPPAKLATNVLVYDRQ
ncbi:MAG: hypothetical protein JF593_07130 [Novosphingobium sp.]|nr:hypothetical protein [Novosphingobium sp.]